MEQRCGVRTFSPRWHGARWAGLIGIAAAVAGSALAVRHAPFPLWVWIPVQGVGICFTVSGVTAWSSEKQNRIGPLMVVVGSTWYIGDLQASSNALLFSVGFCLYHLPAVAFAHLLLVLPDGSLSRWRRRAIATIYGAIFSCQVARCVAEYRPLPQGWGDPHGRYSSWAALGSIVAVCSTIAVIAMVVQRWRGLDVAVRRSHLAVLVTISLAAAVTLAAVGAALVDAPLGVQQVLLLAYALALMVTPVAIRSGVLRTRLLRLTKENARLEEARARDAEAAATSRTSALAAADAERRRVQRDLHDGAQHQLLAVAMLLDRLARQRTNDATGSDVHDLLRAAREQLRSTMRGLRQLAQGVFPAELAEQGLASCVGTMAERAPLPVEWSVPPGRWPEHVEHTAYFVIAEALTNAYKHAGATRATVAVEPMAQQLLVRVADDGRGGACMDAGSGLRGLADRVAAIRGTLKVESHRGKGTKLTVELPCG